ncbi:MAG TPA: hypothetical protein VHX38_01045 [Pseudonocardiaceae bacterium]|jgi:hypothetical protein|nr:hypothetical protein [Pseudonocardiaceae bacterium]
MTQLTGGLHGAYTHHEARAALGVHGLRTAVDNGQLIGFGRGVLLAADRAEDIRTRAAAAALLAGPDSVLVRSSAAVLHGCTSVSGYPVHIRVPYQRRVRSRAGMIVHQGPVDESHVVHRDGLRVLRRAPMLADVLRSASRRGALACADEVLRGLPEPARPEFREEVAQLLAADPDQRGTRQAVDLLGLATGLPESPAQSAVLLVLVESGLPVPRCQHPVHDGAGRLIRRLHFAWPEHRIGLDYEQDSNHDHNHDSVRNGTDPADRACGGNDLRLDAARSRAADLRSRGWLVLRAGPADLHHPTALATHLKEVLADRRLAA